MAPPKKNTTSGRDDARTPVNTRSTSSGVSTSQPQPRQSFGGSSSSFNTSKQLTDLSNKFDRMLANQDYLQKTVDDLLQINREMKAINRKLADKLKSAETTISTLVDELETQKQRFLNNTVEILGSTVTKTDDPQEFVRQLGESVGCEVDSADIGSIGIRMESQRKGPPKPKIVVSFMRLAKRMDFYYKCRKMRLSPSSDATPEFRKLNVVDALTHYKKAIYFEIMEQRKKHPDIVKNIWVYDGDIFIRRFRTDDVEVVKNTAFVDVIFEVPPNVDEEQHEDLVA